MMFIAQWLDKRIPLTLWDIRGTPTPSEVQRATMLLVCRGWFELITTTVQKWLGPPTSYWVAHLPQLQWCVGLRCTRPHRFIALSLCCSHSLHSFLLLLHFLSSTVLSPPQRHCRMICAEWCLDCLLQDRRLAHPTV